MDCFNTEQTQFTSVTYPSVIIWSACLVQWEALWGASTYVIPSSRIILDLFCNFFFACLCSLVQGGSNLRLSLKVKDAQQHKPHCWQLLCNIVSLDPDHRAAQQKLCKSWMGFFVPRINCVNSIKLLMVRMTSQVTKGHNTGCRHTSKIVNEAVTLPSH